MCRETTENTMSAIWGLKATINYLKNNTENIVNVLLEELLANKKSYLYVLENEDIFNEFKSSIIDGHFQWMIDFSYNPNEDETPFSDSNYTGEDVENLTSAYCDFYSLFSQYIENIDESENIQENLEDYCTHLSAQYCGN